MLFVVVSSAELKSNFMKIASSLNNNNNQRDYRGGEVRSNMEWALGVGVGHIASCPVLMVLTWKSSLCLSGAQEF